MSTAATERRREIPVEASRRQPDPDADCGFYALQNLYVWADLTPPGVARMKESCARLYMTAPEHLGLRVVDQLLVLNELQFPLLAGLAVIPPTLTARDCFTPLIDAGCGLLFGYNATYNGRDYGHSVVAESWRDGVVEVLCSGPFKNHGATVEWARTGPEEDEPDPHPHGCKKFVPWDTQAPGTLAAHARGPLVGIRREFVVVWKELYA